MNAGCFLRWIGMLGLIVVAAAEASAHRVNVFAWVEGDRVLVECRYPDGRNVNEGVIRVLDSSGAELLSGKTNAQGEFAFKIPKQTDLTIVLEAGMGHRAEWTVQADELTAAGRADVAAAGLSRPAQQTAPATISGDSLHGPPPAETIQQAIEEALDKKLAPVMKMLAESQDRGIRLSDILGGIGYIIGLVGIAAYLKRPVKGKSD